MNPYRCKPARDGPRRPIPLFLLVILICQALLPALAAAAPTSGPSTSASETAATDPESGAAANPAEYVPDLVINHSGEAAVVIETG